MQNGETATVRYETAPKHGTLMYDSPTCLKHLHDHMHVLAFYVSL